MFYRDFQLLRKVSNTGANALRQIRKTFRERNSRPRAVSYTHLRAHET